MTLTRRQRIAAAALAAGATGAAAARASGVTRRTLGRWRLSAAFRDAVADETERLLDDHRLASGALIRAAVERLRTRLADPLAADGARDRIALAVLRDAAFASFGLGGARPGASRLDLEAAPAGRVLPPILVVASDPARERPQDGA